MPRLKKQQSVGEVRVVRDSAIGDLLPGLSSNQGKALSSLHKISQMFGFDRAETSMIDIADPFGRNKHFNFDKDRLVRIENLSSKKLALRTHNFLSILRAYFGNEINKKEQVTKWYYIEPVYSYENGALSYSHEFGAVSFGEPSAISDAHMINMIRALLEELGISNIVFEVNSKGCDNCSPYYHEVLVNYLQQNRYNLCASCQQRLAKSNSVSEQNKVDELFAVFNCPVAGCQEILSGGPQIIDHLDDSCNKHLTQLLEALDELEIAYQLNPRLFGDSSFSHVIFKPQITITEEEGEKSLGLGVGGRKNRLVERLSGQIVPTLEFSIDLNTILNLIISREGKKNRYRQADVFLINLGGMAAKKSLRLFWDLWKSNIRVAEQFGENGIKNQFKMAQEKGCPIALVVGQKEAMEGTVIMRDVRSGMQEVFAVDRIIEEVKKRLQE